MVKRKAQTSAKPRSGTKTRSKVKRAKPIIRRHRTFAASKTPLHGWAYRPFCTSARPTAWLAGAGGFEHRNSSKSIYLKSLNKFC
jgi:hypothetical protein